MDSIEARTAPDARSLGAPPYRSDIDGLRAIAVTAVVLFHAGWPMLGGGFAGVDIFFVISGFLIGGIVDREVRDGRFSFRGFYLRRARRILPALFAVSAGTLALGLVLLSPDELKRLSASVTAALLGVANIWFWHDAGYFTPDARYSPFLMTWSLGVEEQFYLALPPLLLMLHRWRRAAVLPVVSILGALSLALSIALTAREPVAAFYLLPTRAWELAVGVAAALWTAPRAPLGGRVAGTLGIAGAVAIAIALTCFDEGTAFPGYAALLPTLGTAALIVGGDGWINRRLLATRPLVAVGLLSYSWYLWHWPLMTLVRIASAQAPSVSVLTGVAALSLLIAWASWRRVEQPFRTGTPHPAALGRYAAVLTAAACVAAALWTSGGLPSRVSEDARAAAAVIREGHGGPCLAGYGADAPNTAAACVGRGAAPKIALLGDSHANALGAALREAAFAHGWGFVQMTKASCPPLLGGTRVMAGQLGHAAACLRYNDAAFAAVLADPTIRTVVLTAFWQAPFDGRAVALGEGYRDRSAPAASGEPALIAPLARAGLVLQRVGKRVVILGDVPGFRFDPARWRNVRDLPARAWLRWVVEPGFAASDGFAAMDLVSPLADSGARASAAAARVSGASYAPLADAFCDRRGCRFEQGSTPWFIDPQHLSSPGARHAVRVLDPVLW